MECARNVQNHDLLGSSVLRERHPLVDTVHVATNHDLPRRVEVRGNTHAALNTSARVFDRVIIDAEHRGHRSRSAPTGVEHEFPPKTDGSEGFFERQGTGRHVSAELPE